MAVNRIAVSEFSTYKWCFEQDVLRLASLGFEGIGVWRQKLSDYGHEKGSELLIERSMNVSSLQWAGGFTGNNGFSFEEAIEDARAAILLMRKSLEQVGIDISGSGKIDIDIIMTGKSKSLRDRLQIVLSLLLELEREQGR